MAQRFRQYLRATNCYKLSDSEYIQSKKPQGGKINLQKVNRIFAQMTGVVAPPYNRVAHLDFDKEMLYHTLVMEFLSPIRIVVGYHGWKKEQTLREHIVTMLDFRMSCPRRRWRARTALRAWDQTKQPPAKSWWVQKLSADLTAD